MTIHVERVLIVLNPDGTLKGAHQESLQTYDDGSARQLPASGLDAATLAAILPDQAALAAQVQALTVERDAATAIRSSIRTTLGLAEDATDEQITSAVAAGVAAVAKVAETAPQTVNGVPQQVSPYQARTALKGAGLLAPVMAIIDGLPADDDVRLAWEYAVTWHRQSAFVEAFGAQLGLSSEQVDALFVAAAQVA